MRQALRSPAFWLVSLAFGLASMNISAIIIFIVPHLTSARVGFSPTAAAFIISLFIGFGAPARVGIGFLGDRVRHKEWVVAGIFAGEAVGMVILALSHSYWMAVLFALVMGLAHGAGIPMRPAFYADYFGTRAFNTILGLSHSFFLVLGVLGPVMAGTIFDRTGSYAPAFYIMAAATVVALPILLVARRPAFPREAEPAPARQAA